MILPVDRQSLEGHAGGACRGLWSGQERRTLKAYSLYVKGRALLYRRGASLPVAVECSKRRLPLILCTPLLWLALRTPIRFWPCMAFIHPETSRPKWQEAARRAVAADPSLAEAHCALAFGKLLFDGKKPRRARVSFCTRAESKVLPGARLVRGVLPPACRRKVSGRSCTRKIGLESDPLSCYANTMLSFAYLLAGEYTGAVRRGSGPWSWIRSLFSRGEGLHLGLQLSGRFEEAVAAGKAAVAVAGAIR